MEPSIRLSVPGTLAYRSLAVRVVAEAARLVSGSAPRNPEDDATGTTIDVTHPFDVAVVSAFMEIFNNLALHAYAERDGCIEIAITHSSCELVIELLDQGQPFDPESVAELPAEPDPDALPEGGMGIHIARSMLDDVSYQPGPPNRWRLVKRS